VTQVRHRGHRPKTAAGSCPRAVTQVGSSVVEDCQVDPTKALGVGNHVDFDDACPRDREAETTPRRPCGATTTPHGSVQERAVRTSHVPGR
jgi:hypothetical protein